MRARAGPLPWVLLLALAAPATAQPVLDVDLDLAFDRPESWAMKYVASINLYTGLGVPRASKPGSVEVGFEASWVPSLSEGKATVGFNGVKTEDVNRTPVFGRPRVRIGLPRELTLDLSYLPAIDFDGVEPDLVAIGLERPLLERRRGRLGLRAVAQGGTLEGDVTCTRGQAAAGEDPVRNPFRCEAPSRDELKLRSGSLELSGALTPGDGRWEPYLALAVHHLDLELQVDARYNGFIDRTRGVTDGWTVSAAAGVAYRLRERFTVSGEAFYSPLRVLRPPSTSAQTDDLFHLRTLLGYRVR